jgi:HEAT repeat protein
MKAIKNGNRTISTVLLIAIVLLSSSAVAQKTPIKDVTSNEYALQNLIAGINSENDGVRRSSIYFAGKYRIAEVEDELISQLKEEENPSTRILIALVLYEMGSIEGLIAVQLLAQTDADAGVRRMATHIYNEHLINDANSSVTLNK